MTAMVPAPSTFRTHIHSSFANYATRKCGRRWLFALGIVPPFSRRGNCHSSRIDHISTLLKDPWLWHDFPCFKASSACPPRRKWVPGIEPGANVLRGKKLATFPSKFSRAWEPNLLQLQAGGRLTPP